MAVSPARQVPFRVLNEDPAPRRHSFPFRSWVRNTCRNAIIWGIGAVALLGGVTWLLRDPTSRPLSRAFGALAFYGVLFLASLIKIWWTAGGPAVVLEEGALAYQPLHTFRPRRIPFDKVYACAPKEETHSLRFVHEARPGQGREFFLNLAVIERRTEFLTLLGERLEEQGLATVPGKRWAWRRLDWVE